MIIARTPYRISFFGGGTDYPDWYRVHGGAALSTTINKYCYLTVRYLPPFFEHRYRVIYRKIEMCGKRGDIEHPAVRAVLEFLGEGRGLEIHHDGDLPARSGMGTSSAFTIGLLHAMHALQGRVVPREQLASEGIYLEQQVLKEVVGSQDQVSAAYGGFNRISFHTDGAIRVDPLPLSRGRYEELNSHLMLFYTGIQRTAAKVAETYLKRVRENSNHLERLRSFVDEGVEILTSPHDILSFGELLHEAWKVKRELSDEVSNSQIDEIYELGRRHGAIGGKLLGAGGGGFMLFFAPPAAHARLRQVLRDLIYVPIRFAFEGSRVIFFEPEEDFEELDRTRNQQTLRPITDRESIPLASPESLPDVPAPVIIKPR